jgi:hypothetical protein
MAEITAKQHREVGREVGRFAGWMAIVVGTLLVGGAAALGLSPINVEAGGCGSAWIRTDSPTGCDYYYRWTMWLSVPALVIGLALVTGGVILVRRTRGR